MTQKVITILGSTGSIGTQALDVVRENPDRYKIESLTAGRNASLLIEQIKEFKPTIAVIADESKYEEVKNSVAGLPTKVMTGTAAVANVAANDASEMVLVALVGYSGLAPTIAAIKAHKKIALANKETLVVAGDLVCRLCQENGIKLLPVDSEHSAIFQCLEGERHNKLEKIILTASGGPFRGWTRDKLENVTPEMALKHPNWSMGAKITIDSASMMNKGFEVIEAKWLFDLTPDMIEVQVHPQSIIHSMVQFTDGTVLGQMSNPDMRIPIQFALAYPQRPSLSSTRLDFAKIGSFTFFEPDLERFPCIRLAYESMARGGNVPCAMNAANEEAVHAFLREELPFCRIPEVVGQVVATMPVVGDPSYEDIVRTDEWARIRARELMK